jgi:hypothetical protein
MKPNRTTKALVLAGFVTLLGAYVGYRAVSAREDAGNATTPAPTPTAPATRIAPPQPDHLMRGSKSAFIPVPEAREEAPPTPAPDPATAYGSKSAPIFLPKDVAPPGGSK